MAGADGAGAGGAAAGEAGAGGADAPAPDRPIERLLQDSSLYLLGNAASRIVGFLAIPFYSRFLTPAQYGLIELVELSTQTVAIAFGLQAIGAALSRLFHDQRSVLDERAVVSTSMILTAGLSALVMLVAVIGAPALSQLVFHDTQWVGLLRAAFVAMFFGNMIEVVLVYERIQNRARFFLAYSLYTLGATLALNVLFIGVLGYGVWGFVSSKLVVTTLGSLYLLARVRRDVGWRWRGLFVPQLVKFGAPLVLSSLSYFAIHFSDRFFLSSAVSLAELGRYALAYRFAILVSALVGDSFSKSWSVTLYRYVEQANWREQFAQVASYFTYALFATGLAIAVFSPELLRIMVPKSYFPPPLLLPIIILSYLAREIGDFFRTLLLINKRSVTVGNIAFGGALLNLGANWLLIPHFGIYGAALATLVTWVVYMLVCWRVANAEHRLPVQKAAYLKLFVLVCAFYGMASVTRSSLFMLQAAFDAVWVLAFCAAAFLVFFTPTERRGAFGLCGRMAAWLLMLRVPLQPAGASGANVVMVAYHYPPQNEIGAARPHRFARHLRQGGMTVTVVTSPSPAAEGAEGCVLRVPGHRPPRLQRELSRLLGFMQRVLLPYDDRAAWLPAAIDAAAPQIGPGTVLITTHPPVVTHLAGLVLKSRYGTPWIADFRDPLWGNPFRTSQRATLTDPLLERATVENADAVIANTEASAALLRARYPHRQDRIHVIWNGFDLDDGVVAGLVPREGRRVIAHVGSVYGNRTPLPFLSSLERLIQRGLLDAETIQFCQVGRSDPSCLDLTSPVIESLTLRGCCRINPRNVPQEEARAEMQAAEWLLLLDMNRVNPGLQVPAKLFEYVRTGRPVLALTPEGSSTAYVLALAGVQHRCIDPALEPDAFDAAVLAFLVDPVRVAALDPGFVAAFEAAGQARHLERIIASVGSTARAGA